MNFIANTECGTSANPLSQVLKHADQDRSLQQDRSAGPSSSRLHQLPLNAGPVNEHDAAMARQFFEQNSQGPQFHHAPDLSRFEVAHHDPKWEQPNLAQGPASAAWASEFSHAPGIVANQMSQSQVTARPEAMQHSSYNFTPMQSSYGYGMGGGMGMGMQYGYNPSLQISYPQAQTQDKGKGKSREEDFAAAFDQAALSLSSDATKTEDVDALTKSLEEATLEQKAEDPTFQKMWAELQQDPNLHPPAEDLAKWEAEFSQLMSAERDDLDYGTSMEEAWRNGASDLTTDFEEGSSIGREKALQFDAEGVPQLGEYTFEKNNPYLTNPSPSLLSDAKNLLENNGSLSEAALLIEAAIQGGILGEGGYEAWILLGEVRNMDEREEAGMKALMEGVKRAEAANAGGAGMLALAISFTNESYDRGSHSMLLRWLRAAHPSFPVPESTIAAMSTNSAWDTHGRITECFLGLVREQNARGELEPDTQIGLGVLFYNNSDYDRAKDCFEAALSVRPRDYLLWNRLGSSLSNGNKPEEALGAYREALQLRPTYTRAIYNVGVACLNIGADKEAAEHFLTALQLQISSSQSDPSNAGDGGDTSDQLWFTLRRALLSMGRTDLADLARPEKKTPLEAFRNAGLDF